ncbi:MAG: hypothetical protein Q8Q15_03425 [bacterium]|nr:hypothetical protein [bacterium]
MWTLFAPRLRSGLRKGKLRLKIFMNLSTINNPILDTVQLEGKNPVSWEQFKEAYPEVKLIP